MSDVVYLMTSEKLIDDLYWLIEGRDIIDADEIRDILHKARKEYVENEVRNRSQEIAKQCRSLSATVNKRHAKTVLLAASDHIMALTAYNNSHESLKS